MTRMIVAGMLAIGLLPPMWAAEVSSVAAKPEAQDVVRAIKVLPDKARCVVSPTNRIWLEVDTYTE